VDVTDPDATDRALARDDPDVIIHLAALTSTEEVRLAPRRAQAVNIAATKQLAEWCRIRDRRLLFTSTDLVFSGERAWNREDDPTEPVVAYGRTKLEAERAVLAIPRGIVARLSLLYGLSRSGRDSYFERMVATLRRGESQTLFEDEFRTPLHLATAAEILVRLAESDLGGRIHVGGRERVSRFELGWRAASALGLDPALVHANRQRDISFTEPRPADVSLDTSKLEAILPDLDRPTVEEALEREEPWPS
jgi:dTDP-4-dehydrorhamnose reductase